jgi:Fe2+ transport system protein A
VIMMPLSMIKAGESGLVQRVGGKEETKRFLENLGFVPGSSITLISENEGNVIVQVKESRIAISKGMANKIMVS